MSQEKQLPSHIYIGHRKVTPNMLADVYGMEWTYFVGAFRSTFAAIKRGENSSLESCYEYYRKNKSRREKRSLRNFVKTLCRNYRKQSKNKP